LTLYFLLNFTSKKINKIKKKLVLIFVLMFSTLTIIQSQTTYRVKTEQVANMVIANL